MSEKAAVPETAGEGEKRIRRPRGPRKPKAEGAEGATAAAGAASEGANGRGPRRPRQRKEKSEGGAGTPQEKAERPKREPREPREPRERVPVPPELVGKTSVGKIVDVVERGKGSYGFVALDNNVRVYFPTSSYADASEFKARRGYEVEFTCGKDEKDRVYASSVRLTPAGKATAVEREAKIAADKAAAVNNSADGVKKARPAKAANSSSASATEGGEGEKKPRRERRERPVRPEDDRSLSLTCTCQNSSESKSVVAVLSQSIGKLKHTATEAFGAPPTYNVFHKDALLTKAILRTLHDNDVIHIKEPVATTA
jgi:hypothetical protein